MCWLTFLENYTSYVKDKKNYSRDSYMFLWFKAIVYKSFKSMQVTASYSNYYSPFHQLQRLLVKG